MRTSRPCCEVVRPCPDVKVTAFRSTRGRASSLGAGAVKRSSSPGADSSSGEDAVASRGAGQPELSGERLLLSCTTGTRPSRRPTREGSAGGDSDAVLLASSLAGEHARLPKSHLVGASEGRARRRGRSDGEVTSGDARL